MDARREALVMHYVATKQRLVDLRRGVWRMICGKRENIKNANYLADPVPSPSEGLMRLSVVIALEATTCPRCLRIRERVQVAAAERAERRAALPQWYLHSATITEFRVWNRVLTPEEIAEVARGGEVSSVGEWLSGNRARLVLL